MLLIDETSKSPDFQGSRTSVKTPPIKDRPIYCNIYQVENKKNYKEVKEVKKSSKNFPSQILVFPL